MACLGRTSRQHRCAVLLQFVASPRRAVHFAPSGSLHSALPCSDCCCCHACLPHARNVAPPLPHSCCWLPVSGELRWTPRWCS